MLLNFALRVVQKFKRRNSGGQVYVMNRFEWMENRAGGSRGHRRRASRAGSSIEVRLIPASIKQNHPITDAARSRWPISKSESRNTRGGGRKEGEEEEGKEGGGERRWKIGRKRVGGRLMPKLKPMNRFAGGTKTVRKGRFTLENFLLIF